MYDDYGVDRVEPLATDMHQDDYLYGLNQSSSRVFKELERLSKKIDDMAAQWKSFVDYIKNVDVEEESPSELGTLVRQNEEIIKLNQKTMELLESMSKRAERQPTFTSPAPSPRSYPKIRIVK